MRKSVTTRTKAQWAVAAVVFIAIAVSCMLFAVHFDGSGDASAEPPDSIQYVDTDGNTITKPLSEMTHIEDASYFETCNYTLAGGWYLITASMDVPETITIDDDVSIILGNGVTVRVTALSDKVFSYSGAQGPATAFVWVNEGCDLSIYRESGDSDDMGKMTNLHPLQIDTVFILINGGVLKNSAHLEEPQVCIAVSSSGGTVENSGTIVGGICGIYFEGSGTVINNESGSIIDEADSAIRFVRDGTVENFGEIYGVYGVERSDGAQSGNLIVLNGEGASITGKDYGIWVRQNTLTTVIENYGTIEDSTFRSGIRLESGETVINNHGVIRGYGSGLESIESGETVINNHGVIRGNRSGLESTSAGPLKITNVGTIEGIEPIPFVDVKTALKITNEGAPSSDDEMVALELTNIGEIIGNVEILSDNSDNSLTFHPGSSIDGDLIVSLFVWDPYYEPLRPGPAQFNFVGDLDGSLRYSTVTGNVNAGETVINIDLDGLPDSYAVGDNIVLIGGSSSISYTGGDEYVEGDRTFGISVPDGGADKELIAMELVYLISIDPSHHDWNATEGYSMGDGDVLTVTIKNEGNQPTGAITVSPVAGTGGFFFDLPDLSGGLDAGGSAQFTIVPIDGLSAGTYNVTIAIGPTSSDSDLNTVMFTATFNVASSDPHYVITATSDAGSVISPPGQTEVAQGDDAAFTFQAIDGYRVSSVHVDGIPISSGELESGTYTFRDVSDDHTIDVTSEYAASPSDPHYVITATSDAGSVISPSGQTVVAQGGDATFTFRAADGYHVSSVYVDGKPLSSEELSSGTYTFRNVLSNHSIEVVSAPGQILPDMVLEITVASGHGYAEYSINGSPFERYVSAVALTDGDDVTVAAYADEGYEFKEWSREGILYPDAGTMFENVDSSLYLEIHFVTVAYGTEPDDGVPWWVVGIIVLLIAGGFFFWLLIFWRRYYEVIPPEGMEEVEGYKRAHRKSEYRYLMPDGYSGPMVYHIGEEEEDNEWKPVLMEDGRYVIPKGEITDKVYLEKSPK